MLNVTRNASFFFQCHKKLPVWLVLINKNFTEDYIKEGSNNALQNIPLFFF